MDRACSRKAYLRRGLIAASGLLLLAPPAGGLAQQKAEPPSVSPLTVSPPEMVPVPKVGEGAPLFSAAEMETIEHETRRNLMNTSVEVGPCLMSKVGKRFARGEVDAIAASAARNGGHIVLRPPNPTSHDPFEFKNWAEIEYAAGIMASQLAVDARKATEVAEQARRDAAQGRAGAEAVEAAELDRQKWIVRMTTAIAMYTEAKETQRHGQRGIPQILPGFDRRYVSGVPVPIAAEYEDLKLENIKVRSSEVEGVRVFRISGEVRNTRKRAINPPPLSVTAVDAAGFPLKGAIADPQRGSGRIEPGQTRSFAYELKPGPRNAETVVVTFGTTQMDLGRLPAGMAGCA